MKILLREFDDKEYVWEDAIWKPQEGFKVDNINIRPLNIVSVIDDDRNKYVICGSCGALIRNTPKSIEAHYAKMEKSHDCAKCSYLNFRNKSMTTKEIVKQKDGTHKIKEIYLSDPACKYVSRYDPPHIDSEEAKRGCMYNQCRNSPTSKISDFFIEYPGAFDTIITVDTLLKCNWNFSHSSTASPTRNQYIYDGNLRGSLRALVNSSGFVDRFFVSHNGSNWTVFYSEKYDKLFFTYGNEYNSRIPYEISDAKIDKVYKKIRALYKEAATNEQE